MPRQHHPKFAQNQGRARPCTHPHAPGSHGEEPRPTARTPCRSPTHSHAASARSPSLPATSHPEQHPPPPAHGAGHRPVRPTHRTPFTPSPGGSPPSAAPSAGAAGRHSPGNRIPKATPKPTDTAPERPGLFENQRSSSEFVVLPADTPPAEVCYTKGRYFFSEVKSTSPDASWHPLPIDPAKAVAYRNTPEPVSYATMMNRTVYQIATQITTNADTFRKIISGRRSFRWKQ